MNDIFASSISAAIAFYDTSKAMAGLALSGDLFLQLWIIPGLVMGIGTVILSIAIRRKSEIEERNGHIVFPKPFELFDGLFIGISNLVLFPFWVLSWSAAMLLWAANWPFQYMNFAMDASAKWALEDVKKRRIKTKSERVSEKQDVADKETVPAFADVIEPPVFYTKEGIDAIKQLRDMQEINPKTLIEQRSSDAETLEAKQVH